jgi:hypothetical protein
MLTISSLMKKRGFIRTLYTCIVYRTFYIFFSFIILKSYWKALMIDILSCSLLEDVCINMFRPRDSKTEVYSAQLLNSFDSRLNDFHDQLSFTNKD